MKNLFTFICVWLALSTATASTELSFLLGPSQSKEVGPFGGFKYYVGLGVQGDLSSSAFWLLQLRGDSLGKDNAGVKKDRVSWMAGAGWHLGVLSFALGVGIIDTMTTTSFDPDKTVVDPFTGVTLSSDESGISHVVLAGYMGRVAVEVARWGTVHVKGEMAHFNTFDKTAYGAYSSLGLNVGMTLP